MLSPGRGRIAQCPGLSKGTLPQLISRWPWYNVKNAIFFTFERKFKVVDDLLSVKTYSELYSGLKNKCVNFENFLQQNLKNF